MPAPGSSTMPPLTDVERAMVEANVPLVGHVVTKLMGLRGEDVVDEAVAAGMIGLMRAVQRFDPAKGFRFSTYATWWIRQFVVRDHGDLEGISYRRWKRGELPGYRPALSLDAPAHTDDDDGRVLGSVLAAVEDPEDAALARVSLQETVDRIFAACRDDVDREVVLGIAEGATGAAIARRVGLSGQAIRQRTEVLRQRLDVAGQR